MPEVKDRFLDNAEELDKIIKENIWFGSGNRDIALEFLEAMVDNYKDKVQDLTTKLEAKQNEENEDHEPEIIEVTPPTFKSIDYGLGHLVFDTYHINLKFWDDLETFIQGWKQNCGKQQFIDTKRLFHYTKRK